MGSQTVEKPQVFLAQNPGFPAGWGPGEKGPVLSLTFAGRYIKIE